MSRIAVLGASGFVGREVVRELAARGHHVAAVVRTAAPSSEPGEQRLLVGGDWRQAVDGCDLVVHLVARTHRLREALPAEQELAAYRAVNTEITRRVLAACSDSGVSRIVYMSSVKAMGESRELPYVETDLCAPRDAYGRTKLEAEALVRAAAVDSVVLRPPLVYGAAAGGNIARLVRAIRTGRPLPLGRATAQRSLISVGNLASAVALAAESPAAVGRTFLVSDAELLSVRDLVEALAAGVGRPARLVPVPIGVLRAAGALTRRRDEVDRLVRSLVVDSREFGSRLQWTPPERAHDALRRTGAAA